MKKINFAKIADNSYDYLLLFLSLATIFGALIYYFYALNSQGLILAAFLTLVSGGAIIWRWKIWDKNQAKKSGQNTKTTAQSTAIENQVAGIESQTAEAENQAIKIKIQTAGIKNKIISRFGLVAYFLSYAGLLALLINAQSDRALISPWSVVPDGFFWLYGFASLLLVFILTHRGLSVNKKTALLSLHYFLSFSAALIVYKIGYGFDPFIHQATMELIVEKGAVLPKTPYYLGQYGLLVMLYKLSGISLGLLNKLLVPALAALFLPTAIFRFLKNWRDRKDNFQSAVSSNLLTALFLLILSFPIFIVTTPQNLSYLFLLLSILAGFKPRNYFWTPLLALSAAAVHPLTGLPALAYAALILFKKYGKNLKTFYKKIINILIFLFTALALPLALGLSGGRMNTNGGNLIKGEGGSAMIWLKNLISELFGTPRATGSENIFLNFAYFIFYNYRVFIIIIIIAAVIYFYRRLRHRTDSEDVGEEKTLLTKSLLGLSGALLITYFLSRGLRFNNLIDYEQASYAGRILIIIVIFLLPFLLISLRDLIAAIYAQERMVKIIWLGLGLIMLSAALYISYPRFDRYYNSRGYSTSAADLAAVRLIDEQNTGHYIVLANQQVSAAALSLYGFNHYYQTPSGPLYFYPIPTGGPLYQYYLDMVYKKPDRETALKAMDLAGVNTAYLIINKYWHQSGRVINEAKLTADEWWNINGEAWVFKYGR
jgi:hypothetical protein